uniref:Vitamin D-binding protein n=1 Tax=Scleropages formosus TaxID=113540 RepID=A0A8C9WDQ4_SCLFO
MLREERRIHSDLDPVSKMRIFQVVLTLSAFTLVSAAWEGETRVEELCRERNEAGKDAFKAMVIALYSQRFANGTFEEISATSDHILKILEKCCSPDANPGCYEKETRELVTLFCRKDSPFPKHPDLDKCCGKGEHEWGLCLASLHYSSEELPSLQELTNEEICEQLKHGAQVFSARYTYELSRRYQSIPADLVLKATKNYVEMAEKCCSRSLSKICFLQERLQHKDFNIFLRYASNVCENARHLKTHKTAFMVYYASLLKLPFDDAFTATRSIRDNLAWCCSQKNSRCLTEKFTELHQALCNDSSPGLKSEDFQKCCGKAPPGALPCMDNLERHAQLFPGTALSSLSDLCDTGDGKALQRFWFQTGAKYPSIPVSVFASFMDVIKLISEPCCNASDAKGCVNFNLTDFATAASKFEHLCSKYFKLDWAEFKKAVQGDLQSEAPAAAAAEAEAASQNHDEARAQVLTNFASSCCSRYAPARKCKNMVKRGTFPH